MLAALAAGGLATERTATVKGALHRLRGYGVFFLLKRDERSMDASKLLKMAGSLTLLEVICAEPRVPEVALKLYKARPCSGAGEPK